MADNLAILDGAGESRTLRSSESDDVHTPHHILDQLPGDLGGVDIGGGVFALQVAPRPPADSFAAVDAGDSGDNTLVAAEADLKVKLRGLVLLADDDVTVTLKSSGGAVLSGPMKLALAGNGFVLPIAPEAQHWLESAGSEGLVLALSAAVQVSGSLVYRQEA